MSRSIRLLYPALLVAALASCGSSGSAASSAVSAPDGGPDATADGAPGASSGAPNGASNGASAGGGSEGGSMPADADSDAASDAGPPSPASGPEACGLSACAPGAPCPDLVVDQNEMIGSILIDTENFDATSCAIVEGCITQTGTRRLLHFDTATQNVGNADLTIGDPTQNACFTWSDCHQHYHFKGVGKYTLYQSDGATVAARGHKQGFCLEDVDPIPSLSPPPADPADPYTCMNQGLHVGWEDVYPNNVDCQWIDITGVPAGNYVLSVIVDSNQVLPESNYANNEARATVVIPPP